MKVKSDQRLNDCIQKMASPRFPFIWLLLTIFAVSTLVCWSYLLRLPDNLSSSTVADYAGNHGIKVSTTEAPVQERFYLRKRELGRICPMNESTYSQEWLDSNAKMLDHIIIDDKRQLIYCYIPKVACTNWKRILLKLDGRSNYTRIEDIPSDSVHRDNVFIKLSDLQAKGISDRIKNYERLIFVRNPFERIVSAFKNKFEKNYNSSAYFKIRFGVDIQKKYRTVDKVSQTGDGVEFSEFVQYIIDVNKENPKKLNEHWAPYSQLCFPCDIRYNLIGKYETLEQDASYILKKIGAIEEVRFPKLIPSNTTYQVPQYMATLSDDQVSQLLKIYEQDFKIFNYQPIRGTHPKA